MDDLIPLNCLPAGSRAEIGAVVGKAEQVQRLEELGLRGGNIVEMVQPGSPCIIRLDGQKFCFRADELVQVLVHAGSPA